MPPKMVAEPFPHLKEFFRVDKPFGPIDASEVKDPQDIKHLLDTQNAIYDEMIRHPSMSVIIGRRGSGKTALLRSAKVSSEYHVVVELPPDQAFTHILRTVQNLSDDIVFPEKVAELWKVVLWTPLFGALLQKCQSPDVSKLRHFLEALRVPPNAGPYAVIQKVIVAIKAYGDPHPLDMLLDFAEHAKFGELTFVEAKRLAIALMRAEKIRAIILVDSLDDFQLEHKAMQQALSGLMKCQAVFHEPGSPCALRCCLPSELHDIYMRISANPNKDFQNSLVLSWTAEELLRLAARRFRQYVAVYVDKEIAQSFVRLRLAQRKELMDFWKAVFPDCVANEHGDPEEPAAYILRHTQLLPRQFLMYLNNIAIKNRLIGGVSESIRISGKAIVEGVRETQNVIVQEIFSAFRPVYPVANEVCERCLPFLPKEFRDGDLHRVYNRHGKGFVHEYEDFRTMLVAIGAIGKVEAMTHRYIEAVFEYNLPHRLLANNNHTRFAYIRFLLTTLMLERRSGTRIIELCTPSDQILQSSIVAR
jgi:hypothetical protein